MSSASPRSRRPRHLRQLIDVIATGARTRDSVRAAHFESFRDDARWLRDAAVQGVGIARRVAGGKPRRELALTVFVDEKRSAADIEHPVPPRVTIPALGIDVRTDVVAIGKARLQSNPERPANPGCGISLAGTASGTLGCLVTRNGLPGLHLLTAGHVLTASGLGETPDVMQPGADDGGSLPACKLAAVTKRISLTSTANDFPNVADGAIARLTNDADALPRIPGIGSPTGRTDTIQIGDTVQLVGHASGFQSATIVSLTYTAAFDMEFVNGPKARVGFSELVLCTRFTSDGDSGAAVLNTANQVVGLHLGGSESSSFFCRIGHVCSKLDIEIAK